MSRERALLRRLVELRDKKWLSPPITLDRGGRPLGPSRRWKDDEVSLEHAISAIGLIAAEAAALLAEPEGENDLTIRVPDAFSRLPLEQWVEFTAKLYRNVDGTLLMDGESVTSTPRSRAEAEAMVEAYPKAIMEHGIRFTAETEAASRAASVSAVVRLYEEAKRGN